MANLSTQARNLPKSDREVARLIKGIEQPCELEQNIRRTRKNYEAPLGVSNMFLQRLGFGHADK